MSPPSPSGLFTFYSLSSILNIATCVGFVIAVLLKGYRSRVVRLSALFFLDLGLWSLFYQLWLHSDDRAAAEFYVRTVMIFVAFLPPTFTHFVSELTQRPRRPWLHVVNYALSLAFASQVYQPWFAPYGAPPFLVFPVWPYAGPLFYLHLGHFVVNFLGAQVLMYRVLQTEQGLLRQKIAAIFWGNLIAVIFGTSNYLPWLRHLVGVAIPPLFPPYVAFMVSVYGLAVIRHQLMDIEVVIKRTLVFAGLVGAVVMVVSLAAFLAQDVLAQVVRVPKVWSNVIAAVIIAASYGRVRGWLVNVTDRYLFQRTYDYKRLLKQFSDEVIVTMNLQQVVQSTVRTLSETVKPDSCSLLLRNPQTRQYEVAASRGIREPLAVLTEDEPLVRLLRETHEPLGTDGELGKVRFPEAVTRRLAQLNARLCLPLHVHDELKGVLCLGRKKSDEEFTRDDLDILQPLSKTLGIAVANAQLFDALTKTQAEAAQKEKLAVIGTLSAGINHEIRNPLGIVKAQCEAFLLDWQEGLLRDRPSQELFERCLDILRGAIYHIDRATRITQQLSNFARPIQELDVQPVSVADEVQEVLALISHDLQLEQIAVRTEIQPGLARIPADRRQIQEILFNLIRNAGQAIRPPGTITIRAFQRDGRVQMEIEDTGVGIDADHLEKIYDPFFTTKTPGKGTGLGLFIVRQMVERNQGRIAVKSTVGRGTTFSLEFPAVERAEEVTAGHGRS